MDYGFRLPCAYDNRPLKFDEFEQRHQPGRSTSPPPPASYEQERSGQIVEQVIRPTGLLDPRVEVRPIEGQIDDLIGEINIRAARQERVLVTTLTKKMAEDLTDYLTNAGIKVRYMHSRHRHHRAHGDHPGPAPGRVRRAGGHQPAAGGPGSAGGEPGGHSGRGQGGLPAQRDQL